MLARNGSRVLSLAGRALLAGSRDAKAGAGIRGDLSSPNYAGFFSQARFSHSKAAPTIVVVVHEDPDLGRVYAESISKAVSQQMALLDKLHHPTCKSHEEADRTTDKPDSNVEQDLAEDCKEKKPHIVSFVVDGKLCENEIEALCDEKMKASFGGNRHVCAAAVEQLGKKLDDAFYRINWVQESIYEKLDARMVAQKFVLEDLHASRPRMNFVDGFFLNVGERVFPQQVMNAGRHLLTLVPYGSKYYFYGVFVYSLLTSDIPPTFLDYGMIVMGAHWLAADELKGKLTQYHVYDRDAAKSARDAAAKKARDASSKKACDGQKTG